MRYFCTILVKILVIVMWIVVIIVEKYLILALEVLVVRKLSF